MLINGLSGMPLARCARQAPLPTQRLALPQSLPVAPVKRRPCLAFTGCRGPRGRRHTPLHSADDTQGMGIAANTGKQAQRAASALARLREKHTMKQTAQIVGEVEFRSGDGPKGTIRRGSAEIETTKTDVTLSWVDGETHGVAAMPLTDFQRYVAAGAIRLLRSGTGP